MNTVHAKNPAMTLEEFTLMNELLSTRFGFHFPITKKEILESRLVPRLAANSVTRYLDYYLLLKFGRNGNSGREIRELVAALTNHETYFFRENHQFEALYGPGLSILQESRHSFGDLRILCAGCSTGEEPYTLNIYAKEHQYQLIGSKVHISAFDLDPSAVKIARQGEYGHNSMRAITPEKSGRYFTEIENERFRIRPLYRDGIHFSVGNIVDPLQYGLPGSYDAVFCRNVLIYFTEHTMETAISHFHMCLRPGGLLFLGHSESIIGKTDAFEAIKLGTGIVYKKHE